MSSLHRGTRERWTWINQRTQDGFTVLSPIKQQFYGTCVFFSTEVTLEANLRVQKGFNTTFSVLHLIELHRYSLIKYPREGVMVRRLLNVLRTEGVLMEEDFTNIHAGRLQMKDCYRCCLESIREYSPYDIFDMREALRQMRATGPLLAVIDISENYDNCRDSGHIYSFEPENVVVDESDEPVTHAICVVAFVIEKGTACFDCQDSQGPNWSKGGFITVDARSVRELYSFKIK